VQALGPDRYDQQRKLRRGLPSDVSTFISRFQETLPPDVASDERFAYRLFLLPMKGPKTDADMALNFVRQDELTPDELQALLGQQGSVIVAEKFKEGLHVDAMLPKAAAAAVQQRIPFTFNVSTFTKLRKKWQVGPAKTGDRHAMAKSEGLAVYSPAFGQFVYTPALVDRMVSAVETEGGFAAEVGQPPRTKPTDRPAQ
jgi:hypothetical protein